MQLSHIIEATRGRPFGALPDCLISRVTIDSRNVRPGDLFIAIPGERFDGHDFLADVFARGAAAALIADPQRAEDVHRERMILVSDTIQALGRLGASHRSHQGGTVIAVTGSNGKTTTKMMIHHVLLAARRGRAAIKSYNNHIGVPLTLLSAEPGDAYLVAELGSNAPGEIDALAALTRPDIAVVTSVGLAHLEGFGDIGGVCREKLSLLDHLQPGGLAVVNIDEPAVRQHLSRLAEPGQAVVTFGTHPDADLRATEVQVSGKRICFRINDRAVVMLPVLGQHNASNALAAYAVARRVGLPHDMIVERLQSFEMPDMRLNVRQIGSMLIVNDSYNANPTSMRAALDALRDLQVGGRRVAILGDMGELGDSAERLHREIGRAIAASDVDVLVGVGHNARAMCDEADRSRPGRIEVHTADTTAALQPRLTAMLKPRDTILLKGSRAIGLEQLLATWPGATGAERRTGSAEDLGKDPTSARAVSPL